MRGKGQGHGKDHAGGMGQGDTRGEDRAPGWDGATGRERDDAIVPPQAGIPNEAEDSLIRHGRSEDSPGHRKQAAGAKSARDFAPGRSRRA